jgi:hypothetical protein
MAMNLGVEWVCLYVDVGPYVQYLMTHKRPKVLLVDILAKFTKRSTLRAKYYTEVCIFRGYEFHPCLFICLHECLYLL